MTGHRPYTFENRTDSCYRFDSPLSRWDLELGCDEKGPLESARDRQGNRIRMLTRLR
ncbi:uncharacterized protein FFB14_02655 [Fusarium fujikuroi]|nr:uncharacterized protein FFB14_02655 [Fusarium fujikuroi]